MGGLDLPEVAVSRGGARGAWGTLRASLSLFSHHSAGIRSEELPGVFGSELELSYTVLITVLFNSSEAIKGVVGWINTVWCKYPLNARIPVNLKSSVIR